MSHNKNQIKTENIQHFEKIYLTSKSWYQYQDNFIKINQTEFEDLWNLHPKEKGTIKIYGKVCNVPRYQELFTEDPEHSYSFSSITKHGLPITNPIIRKALDLIKEMNKDEPYEYNAVFVNWYEPNDYIGLHSDDDVLPVLKYEVSYST